MRLDGEIWTARTYDEDQVFEPGDARAGDRDPGRHGARGRLNRRQGWSGLIVAVVLVVFALFVAAKTVRIIPQARAGVVERLGRYSRTLTPGLAIVVPFVDRVRPLIDLREQVVTFPPQPVITADNVSVGIDTVLYFTITDPKSASYEIANPLQAIEQLTVTTLRNIVGSITLEEALTSRDQVNDRLRDRARRAHRQVGDPRQRRRAQVDRPAGRASRRRWRSRCAPSATAAPTILTAEGVKQSQILTAEGEKQSAVLQAEGAKKAAILRAEGEAQAIDTVFHAIHEGDPDPELLSYQYLQMLPQLAPGRGEQDLGHPQRVHAGAGEPQWFRRRRDGAAAQAGASAAARRHAGRPGRLGPTRTPGRRARPSAPRAARGASPPACRPPMPTTNRDGEPATGRANVNPRSPKTATTMAASPRPAAMPIAAPSSAVMIALVADHAPHLAARHADRAQHPELAGALEGREHERVDDAEQGDDHGQRQQHVEDGQQLVDAAGLLLDVGVLGEHLGVREGVDRPLQRRGAAVGALTNVRRSLASVEAPAAYAGVQIVIGPRPSASITGEFSMPRTVSVRRLSAGRDDVKRVADAEVVLLGPALVDDRAVGAQRGQRGGELVRLPLEVEDLPIVAGSTALTLSVRRRPARRPGGSRWPCARRGPPRALRAGSRSTGDQPSSPGITCVGGDALLERALRRVLQAGGDDRHRGDERHADGQRRGRDGRAARGCASRCGARACPRDPPWPPPGARGRRRRPARRAPAGAAGAASLRRRAAPATGATRVARHAGTRPATGVTSDADQQRHDDACARRTPCRPPAGRARAPEQRVEPLASPKPAARPTARGEQRR